MEVKITYFEKPGDENTEATLALARKRAEELGIKTILVASTSGKTGARAMDALKGFRIIVVSHSYGFRESDTRSFTEENRKIVESKGGRILTAAHAFGGISRAFRQSEIPQAPATYVVGDLIASTLRVFSQGVKVTCEIATMAADAGLVRTDEEVIAIAGTGNAGSGADTAIVVKPDNAHRFFDLRVKELICKPRL
ncbi:pyruvate kinase alpha/beta domain-containing protein [Chloroflexota bacterium]